MCQTCYERGYNDYPSHAGSAAHLTDYDRGFNEKMRESNNDPEELYETDFCEKCFNRGVYDFNHNTYSPPTTSKRGHESSYRDGYDYPQQKEQETRSNSDRASSDEHKYTSQSKQETSVRANTVKLKTYETKYRPPTDDSWQIGLIKIVFVIAIIVAIVWFVFKVILPFIIIDIAIIALIISIFYRKTPLRLVSILGAVYLLVDYNKGWLTSSLIETISLGQTVMDTILYLNITAGLISSYLIIIGNVLNKEIRTQHANDKRKLVVATMLILIGAAIFTLQQYFGSENHGVFKAVESPVLENVDNIVGEAAKSPLQNISVSTTTQFNRQNDSLITAPTNHKAVMAADTSDNINNPSKPSVPNPISNNYGDLYPNEDKIKADLLNSKIGTNSFFSDDIFMAFKIIKKEFRDNDLFQTIEIELLRERENKYLIFSIEPQYRKVENSWELVNVKALNTTWQGYYDKSSKTYRAKE